MGISYQSTKEGNHIQKLLTNAICVLAVAVATSGTASGLVVGVQLEVGALPARGVAGIAALTASLKRQVSANASKRTRNKTVANVVGRSFL